MERGYNMGNTNMTLGVYTTLGKIGCLLKTHPMAEEWAKSAIKGINVSLESNHHLPDTTQDEWYGHLTLDMITQAGVFLKTAGFHNVFDDLRYKYGLDFYGQLLTPTDPHCNAGYIAPFGQWASNLEPFGRMEDCCIHDEGEPSQFFRTNAVLLETCGNPCGYED